MQLDNGEMCAKHPEYGRAEGSWLLRYRLPGPFKRSGGVGMESKELVTLNAEKEIPTTTSLLIAEKFGKTHKVVLRAIRNMECSEKFSRCNFVPCFYKKKGREYQYFEMTRNGFSMLVMGFTGAKSYIWKEEYINLFDKMFTRLKQIDKERSSVDWMKDRIDGKIQRRKLTDKLLPFVLYSEDQGHIGTARNAYSNFTRLVNKYADIKAGERDLLTGDMLRRVGFLENIIESKVQELMVIDMNCKEIYAECKTAISKISEMVPYNGDVYLPVEKSTTLNFMGEKYPFKKE
jgi:Rha family phage regulatory protein